MSDKQNEAVSRRTFIKAGVVSVAAAGLSIPAQAKEGDDQPKKDQDGILLRRRLGKTGESVTMLNFGASRGASPRLLNAMHAGGIRYIDTAQAYLRGESEKQMGQWFAATGRRKEFFVVTKNHPQSPEKWLAMIDERLQALQTDYIDLLMYHGMGGRPEEDRGHEIEIPKSKEWAKAAEQLKKSGKVRHVGLSTHAEMPQRIAILNAAAAGGWVEAIMVASDPRLVKENTEFNKALDACHKADIGLVCMKEMRALGDPPKVPEEFKNADLTPHQAVLHAVWTDQRFASICSHMPNLKILHENIAAARRFQPLDDKKLSAVIDLYRCGNRAYCNGCDGRCQRAAGTQANLHQMARAVSYARDGDYERARAIYAALTPEERDWAAANLAAASNACVSRIDFAKLMPEVAERFA